MSRSSIDTNDTTRDARDSAARGAAAMTADEFLAHWQGHRRLTRRVILAFPEDRLFTYSIGGMRTFGEMMGEVVRMPEPTLRGAIEDVWEAQMAEKPADRAALLQAWDETTEAIDEAWGRIPPGRFGEVANAFGMWTQPVILTLAYLVDNEIHHRAQGYVYLRSLGIEPPAFYER